METQYLVKREIEKIGIGNYKIDVRPSSEEDSRQFVQISIGSSEHDSTHDSDCSYLDFWYNEKEQRLEHINLSLKTNLRGKGLGGGLVKAMEQVGKDLKCSSVRINVNVNPSFWKHMGYQSSGEFWEKSLS